MILAAGRSERFASERPKQLAELHGKSLLRHVVDAALGARSLGQVLVVIGYRAPKMLRELKGLGVEIVENATYGAGQSNSLRRGLEHVDPAARAALFLPADQPLVTSRLIDRLVAAYASTGRSIVRPHASGRPGAPVLWDRVFFPALAALGGDAGGRQLLPRHAAEVYQIEVDDPLELADVDTVADLRRLALPKKS